jgi:trans-2-enoyl-CoA reductase
MVSHDYEAINSEKTSKMLFKQYGDDFIIHAIFVDNLKSITDNKRLMDEFLELYGQDFDLLEESQWKPSLDSKSSNLIL